MKKERKTSQSPPSKQQGVRKCLEGLCMIGLGYGGEKETGGQGTGCLRQGFWGVSRSTGMRLPGNHYESRKG